MNDVIVREHLVDADAGPGGPQTIFGRHFGGNVTLASGALHCLAHEALAVSIAIRESRIDEIHAEFNRVVQSIKRGLVGSADPLFAADAPGAIPDLAALEAGPAELAIFHCALIIG